MRPRPSEPETPEGRARMLAGFDWLLAGLDAKLAAMRAGRAGQEPERPALDPATAERRRKLINEGRVAEGRATLEQDAEAQIGHGALRDFLFGTTANEEEGDYAGMDD